MTSILMYHDPACSKSRGARDILDERGVEVEVVEYLESPLERATIESIVDLLPDPPAELVRKDKNFEALGLREEDYRTKEAVVDLLLAHGELMQRPVVILGDRAVIARPSEKVLELLKEE